MTWPWRHQPLASCRRQTECVCVWSIRSCIQICGIYLTTAPRFFLAKLAQQTCRVSRTERETGHCRESVTVTAFYLLQTVATSHGQMDSGHGYFAGKWTRKFISNAKRWSWAANTGLSYGVLYCSSNIMKTCLAFILAFCPPTWPYFKPKARLSWVCGWWRSASYRTTQLKPLDHDINSNLRDYSTRLVAIV